MTIAFHADLVAGLLIVTASGRDEHPQEVIDYGDAVIARAVETGALRILCDERGLEYRLGTCDTFQVAQTIAARAPKVLRVAIVCRPQDYDDGKFWENVVVNRGVRARVFVDFDQAKAWLESGSA